jgi:hypothetical protein
MTIRHLAPLFALTGLFLMVALGGPGTARAEVPYTDVPQWISTENAYNGTGCDFGDVDGDGDLDLAVSNGNDIVQAPNLIYWNTAGVLPTTASWVSQDQLYSGHCEFGDLDGDGLPELMVANYIAPGWGPEYVQVYCNSADGLGTSPCWISQPSVHSFRATLGDVDGDGDLDLAVATGEAYNGDFEPNLLYLNEGGQLASLPSWQSTDEDASYDTQFVDIDNDGDLDLAVLNGSDPEPGAGGVVKIYGNENGQLSALPVWQSAHIDNGNTFDFADINGDGWQDLAVAYNTQLGGSGRFAIYYSDGGVLSPTPDWESATIGYGSAANFCDVDGDGDQDLVAGRWWGRVSIFLNEGGSFATSPDWQCASNYQSVIENFAFADLDGAGARSLVQRYVPEDGQDAPRLYYLPHRHLQTVTAVEVDGEDLPATSWCYSRELGWVSIGVTPADSVRVMYRASNQLDMAVSNWDDSTYLWESGLLVGVPPGAAGLQAVVASHQAYPNPFNPRTTIAFTLARNAQVRLPIYDLRGRQVAVLVDGELPAGRHEVLWDAAGLPSGLYVYRIIGDGQFASAKLQLVR